MAGEANPEVAGEMRQRLDPHDFFLPWHPWQTFGSRRCKQAPEERLMIAVLHDALDCLEQYRFTTECQGRRLFHQAKRWFLADDRQWPFSFARICDALDLDPATVRRRLATRAVAERTSRILAHS